MKYQKEVNLLYYNDRERNVVYYIIQFYDDDIVESMMVPVNCTNNCLKTSHPLHQLLLVSNLLQKLIVSLLDWNSPILVDRTWQLPSREWKYVPCIVSIFLPELLSMVTPVPEKERKKL